MVESPSKIWEYLTRPSQREEKDREEVLGRAQAVLQWAAMPYHPRFLKWLQDEANRPVNPSPNHMDMLVGATRSNTFREVMAHIRKLESQAHIALGDE